MLVKKGSFIFCCKIKGGIPMTLDNCEVCKMSKGCTLHEDMKELSYSIEYDTRDEVSSIMFRRELIGW